MSQFSMQRPLRAVALSLFTAGVLGLASLAQAQPADARGPGGQQGGHPPMAAAHGGLPQGPMLDRLLDDVKASAEQQEQIRKILQANRPDQQEGEGARQLQDQLMQAFVKADPKAAEAARQQMAARQDAAARRSVQVMMDVAKVLTPEQRKLMAEKMRQPRGNERGGERGGERRGGPGRDGAPGRGGDACGAGAGEQDRPAGR